MAIVYEVRYVGLAVRLVKDGQEVQRAETPNGYAGTARVRSDELVDWLASRPGCMIVGLTELCKARD